MTNLSNVALDHSVVIAMKKRANAYSVVAFLAGVAIMLIFSIVGEAVSSAHVAKDQNHHVGTVHAVHDPQHEPTISASGITFATYRRSVPYGE